MATERRRIHNAKNEKQGYRRHMSLRVRRKRRHSSRAIPHSHTDMYRGDKILAIIPERSSQVVINLELVLSGKPKLKKGGPEPPIRASIPRRYSPRGGRRIRIHKNHLSK